MNENEPEIGISKNNFRAIIILLVLIFVGFLILFFSSNWRDNQKIKKIEVSGNQALTKKEIVDFALDTSGGKNRGDFNLSDLKLKLERHPYIYRADVVQNSSDELLFNVVERKPFAALVNQDGYLEYIDKECKVLPYQIYSKYAETPIIRNALNFTNYDSVKVAIALNFLKKADSLRGGSFYKNISEIIFNYSDKSFAIISADAGIKVLLPEDISSNNLIQNIDIVWQKLSSSIDLKQVSYVDLRWKDRIVAGYPKFDSANSINK